MQQNQTAGVQLYKFTNGNIIQTVVDICTCGQHSWMYPREIKRNALI